MLVVPVLTEKNKCRKLLPRRGRTIPRTRNRFNACSTLKRMNSTVLAMQRACYVHQSGNRNRACELLKETCIECCSCSESASAASSWVVLVHCPRHGETEKSSAARVSMKLLLLVDPSIHKPVAGWNITKAPSWCSAAVNNFISCARYIPRALPLTRDRQRFLNHTRPSGLQWGRSAGAKFLRNLL